jgi:hypothetical protein
MVKIHVVITKYTQENPILHRLPALHNNTIVNLYTDLRDEYNILISSIAIICAT